MPQIRQVVSEALQSTVRRLLPSQQGFTEDLMATNVITPIIDLTPSAEGSALDTDLARAIDDSGQYTEVTSGQTGISLINATGFIRCVGTLTTIVADTSASTYDGFIFLDSGLSTQKVFDVSSLAGISTQDVQATPFDFVVFVKSGNTLKATSTSYALINVYCRQIADLNGNLVNPSGYSPS